jgi:hypothetical protein
LVSHDDDDDDDDDDDSGGGGGGGGVGDDDDDDDAEKIWWNNVLNFKVVKNGTAQITGVINQEFALSGICCEIWYHSGIL